MKKLILISALLFSFNGWAELNSNEDKPEKKIEYDTTLRDLGAPFGVDFPTKRYETSFDEEKKKTDMCQYNGGIKTFCMTYCPDGREKEAIWYQDNGVLILNSLTKNKCQDQTDAEIPWRNSILDYIGDFQSRIYKVELSYGSTLNIDYTCEGVKGLNRKLKVKFKDGLGELESRTFGENCSSMKRFFKTIYIDGDFWMDRSLSRPLLNALSNTKNPVALIEEAYLEINGIDRSSDIPENINPENYPLLTSGVYETLSEPIVIGIQLTGK